MPQGHIVHTDYYKIAYSLSQDLFQGKSWSFDHIEPMISKVYCFIQLHAIFIQLVLGLAISYCHYASIDYLNVMNPLSP